jgi:hypothetical protein
MQIGILIAVVIVAAMVVYLIYMVHELPKKLDQEMRFLFGDYKRWAEGDNRHIQRINLINKKQAELAKTDDQSLDLLRYELARVKVELDQIQLRNEFQNSAESADEQLKKEELEDVEKRVDEHPDRERELEETRTRLVARMEDIRAQEEGNDPGP